MLGLCATVVKLCSQCPQPRTGREDGATLIHPFPREPRIMRLQVRLRAHECCGTTVGSRGRVRDFDHLFGCLRSMMEIAGTYRSGATKFEAVRSLRLREGMMRCTLG